MSQPEVRLAFDYVDPGSHVVSRLLDRALERRGAEARPLAVVHHPLEIRPPPRPLIDPRDMAWREAGEEVAARAEALDIPLRLPAFVPWSRKAHELALHAREKGCFPQVHRSLFEAHFVEGRDIGRVDVLVEIAAASGLDRTESRAVLDVDRFAETVVEWRVEAERARIAGVPTLLFGGARVEGIRGRELDRLLERIVHF